VRDPSVSKNSPQGQRYALAGTKVDHVLDEFTTDGQRAADGIVVQPPKPGAPRRPGRPALHGADRVADRAERRARKEKREEAPSRRVIAKLPPRLAQPPVSTAGEQDAPTVPTEALRTLVDMLAKRRPGLWLTVDGVMDMLADSRELPTEALGGAKARRQVSLTLDRDGDKHAWRYRARGTKAEPSHPPGPRRPRAG
jgi:hypothetical protein